MLNKFGFTLLEMSLTVLIVSIVLVGGINFQLSLTDSSHKSVTENRLKRIESAISEYFIQNSRLPCPSSLIVANNNSSFGNELRNSSTQECYSANTSFMKSYLIYGGVPTKVLGLTNDFGVDGWGDRIIYVIDKNYGNKISFLQNGGEAITIKNTNDDIITNKAIYVLFSSGENRNGAFINSFQNKIDDTLNDSENAFKLNFNNLFVKDIKNEKFDDILLYEEKRNILLNLDIEDALCNLKELSFLDSNYAYTINSLCPNGLCQYGIEIPAKSKCSEISKNPKIFEDDNFKPVRKCLKYGEWSEVLYGCERGCSGELNIYNVTGGNFSVAGQLRDNINLKYIKRAKDGEEITLECVGDKAGYVIIKCISNSRGWEYLNGDCYSLKDKI